MDLSKRIQRNLLNFIHLFEKLPSVSRVDSQKHLEQEKVYQALYSALAQLNQTYGLLISFSPSLALDSDDKDGEASGMRLI